MKVFKKTTSVLITLVLFLAMVSAGLPTAYAVMEEMEAQDVQSVEILWPLLEEHNPTYYAAYPKLQSHTVNQSCSSSHNGIDIWTGTNDLTVSAVADGVVDNIWTSTSGTYVGNQYIRIKHENLYKGTVYSLYCHLSGYYDGIQKGSVVKAGDPIAYSGNSGGVAYHLHFSMFRTKAYYGNDEQVINNNKDTGVFKYLYAAQIHTHDFSTFAYYQDSHPHYAVYQCSCGATQISSETHYVSTCAQCVTVSGTCGDNVTWALNTETGELIIRGTGEMENYAINSLSMTPTAPWFFPGSVIRSVTIEEGIKSIGRNAFAMSSLTSVTISNSVTSIGSQAFASCDSLIHLSIGNSVTTIGTLAFRGCSSLSNVVIPDSVTHIEFRAFEGSGLEQIRIGRGVVSIGESSFMCDNLKSITVDANNVAFSSDENGVLYNKDKSQLILYPQGSVRKLFVVPNCVTSIGERAFFGSKNLVSVTIPNSVTEIADHAFGRCTSLESVHIPKSTETIGSTVFFNDPGTLFICSDTADCYAKTYADANGIAFRICDGHGASTKTPTVTIQNYVPSRSVDFRTTITFEATIQNPVSGAQVHWFVDEQDTGTGETYTVKEAKKSYTVQAKYIKDGRVLAQSPVEEVNVKTGFFARLKAFFRALFGMLPKEVQEVYDTELFLNLLP